MPKKIKKSKRRPKNRAPGQRTPTQIPKLAKSPKSTPRTQFFLELSSRIKSPALRVWALVATVTSGVLIYHDLQPGVELSLLPPEYAVSKREVPVRIFNPGFLDVRITGYHRASNLETPTLKGCPPMLWIKNSLSRVIEGGDNFDFFLSTQNTPEWPVRPILYRVYYEVLPLGISGFTDIVALAFRPYDDEGKIIWAHSSSTAFGPNCDQLNPPTSVDGVLYEKMTPLLPPKLE